MTRRQILYMVLSFGFTFLFVLILIVLVLIFDKPQVEIVWQENAATNAVAKKHKLGKWEGKGKTAIRLVKKTQVPKPKDPEAKPAKADDVTEISLGQLMADKFIATNFKTHDLDGWRARFLKKSYYFVSYRYRDELVDVGPAWLVDVKHKTVIPKNAMAKAAMKPGSLNTKQYFERSQQVVRSIAAHTFPSGINLGGIMLIHFSRLKAQKEGDKILGWTVVHHYGDIYRAFFQWIEHGETTYAEFEFDYKKRALRGQNLQAANLMQEGAAFEEGTSSVSILPKTYNPGAEKRADRWTGATRKACASPKNRDKCNALATILQDHELIEAMQWLLAARANTAQEFEDCKLDRKCMWRPSKKEKGIYQIEYMYDLGKTPGVSEEKRVAWEVDVKKKKIVPLAKLSDMAFRAVHPRSDLNL